MDIYTKFFLANLLSIFVSFWLDSRLLNDGIEGIPVVGEIFGLWAVLSFISVPVWLFYVIISL